MRLKIAAPTQTNGEAIMSRTPKAAMLDGSNDLSPTSRSVGRIAVSLYEPGFAARSMMPTKQTDMLTADDTKRVFSKNGPHSLTFHHLLSSPLGALTLPRRSR